MPGLSIQTADRFSVNSTSVEVPEWEHICKPITPLWSGDRDPSSALQCRQDLQTNDT